MFKKFKWFLLLIISASNFPLAVTVDGYAYLENQSDHSGITVTFERTAPSSLTDSTVTDENGLFTIQLEAGMYNVTFFKNEFFAEFLFEQSIFSDTQLSLTTLNMHESFISVPDMYSSIQSAIDVAYENDTILVAVGTYFENINFLGKSLIVVSQYFFSLDTLDINSTIIDGGENSSVVTFSSGESLNSKLIGFTLTNGGGEWGGGINCDNSSPTLNHLKIISNKAWRGGGGIYFKNSSAAVSNILIKDNEHTNQYPNYYEGGGGIYIYESDDIILDNIILDNNSTHGKGGGMMFGYGSSPTIYNLIAKNNLAFAGGGIYSNGDDVPDPHPILYDALIYGNSSEIGGGVAAHEGSITIINSKIYQNSASNNGGGYYGSSASYCYLDNVQINNNSSLNEGGAIWKSYRGNLEVNNCTIDNNNSSLGGGIFCDQTSLSSFVIPSILNSIISNNSNYGLYHDSGNSSIVKHCNFFNNGTNFNTGDEWLGNSVISNLNGTECDLYYNIQLDPLFVNPSG